MAACASPAPSGTDSAIVTAVIDGDTIEVSTGAGLSTVRLTGLNAPERDECYSDEAKAYLTDLLLGEPVRLDVEGKDQFDRDLATVHNRDLNVNRDLVQRGYAIAMTVPSGSSYVDDEAIAFQAHVGLWSQDACGSAKSFGLTIADLDPRGETITISNRGTVDVQLAGWVIRDESSRHRFRFGPGAVIGPERQMVIASDDPGWDPGEPNVWNNDGDMALLLDRDGRVIDRLRYGP